MRLLQNQLQIIFLIEFFMRPSDFKKIKLVGHKSMSDLLEKVC